MNTEIQQLYSRMFEAQQNGNTHLSEILKIEFEELRNRTFPKPDENTISKVLTHLPEFAKSVLGKNHQKLAREEKSNCINAAFNFHDQTPCWPTYSTMDFLSRVQTDFFQVEPSAEAKWGDLIVLWSRTGGSWDNHTIDVHKMKADYSDFPYGLVFDHVAVRLNESLVFHKPDPTLESRYQIDFLDSVVGPTAANRGFELTFHRARGDVPYIGTFDLLQQLKITLK